MTDNLHAQGYFTVEVIRDSKNGPEVIHRETVPNLVVNTGKRQIWRIVQGANATTWDQMRIGTSGAAAGSADTNVKSPVAATIKTVNSYSLLNATRTAQWVYSYPSGGGSISAANIKEVVLLNQHTSPGGSALCRAVFTAVTKTTSDKLKITYQSRIS